MFVELAGRIVRHRKAVDAALDHGLSQGLIESTNTKIRLLTRIAFGFRSPRGTDRPGHAGSRRTPPRTAWPPLTPRASLDVSFRKRRRFCATRSSVSMSFRLAPARGLHMDTSHARSANEQLSRKESTKTPSLHLIDAKSARSTHGCVRTAKVSHFQAADVSGFPAPARRFSMSSGERGRRPSPDARQRPNPSRASPLGGVARPAGVWMDSAL